MSSQPPLLDLVIDALEEMKAKNITSLDVRAVTSVADDMVIASGRSARHVDAMTEHLLTKLKSAGRRDVQSEGRKIKDWVLIDAGHVIVHLFRPEVRAYYDLEKLWEAGIAEHDVSEASTV